MTARRLEDLYDVAPVEVVLVGGLRAGERMLVPDPLPFCLLMPDPVPEWMFPVISEYVPGDPIRGPAREADRTTLYLRTGSVRDDGARVYEAQR